MENTDVIESIINKIEIIYSENVNQDQRLIKMTFLGGVYSFQWFKEDTNLDLTHEKPLEKFAFENTRHWIRL